MYNAREIAEYLKCNIRPDDGINATKHWAITSLEYYLLKNNILEYSYNDLNKCKRVFLIYNNDFNESPIDYAKEHYWWKNKSRVTLIHKYKYDSLYLVE